VYVLDPTGARSRAHCLRRSTPRRVHTSATKRPRSHGRRWCASSTERPPIHGSNQ
jgi:hypothetical protein